MSSTSTSPARVTSLDDYQRPYPQLAPPGPGAGESHSGPSSLRGRSPSGSPLLQRAALSSTPQHPGCVLCTLVAFIPPPSQFDEDASGSAGAGDARSPSPTATTSFLPPASTNSPTYPQPQLQPAQGQDHGKLIVQGREIVYHDNDIAIYRAEGKERLCPDGKHLIVVLNRHRESIYDLGPADVPILSNIIDTTHQILSFTSGTTLTSSRADAERGGKPVSLRVGFVGTNLKDPQSPHKHLHAHALWGPIDKSLPGAGLWRRNVVFGPMNWWSIEDLRAEIRESTSNNRIKSGYSDRGRAPIDRVPDAGAREGLPNALDPDPYTDTPRSRRSDKQPEVSRETPTPTRSGMSSRLAAPAHERSLSDASSGGSYGDEEGYVAVDFNEGSSSSRR